MYAIKLNRIKDWTTYPLVFDTSAMDDYRWRLGGREWSAEGLIKPGGGAWANQAFGIWLVHNGRANGLFADFHVEACDGPTLQKTSVYNRNTSTKSGIAAWKTQDGAPVLANW
jgi:prepilin-type processing-associated H-X9-DG protein